MKFIFAWWNGDKECGVCQCCDPGAVESGTQPLQGCCGSTSIKPVRSVLSFLIVEQTSVKIHLLCKISTQQMTLRSENDNWCLLEVAARFSPPAHTRKFNRSLQIKTETLVRRAEEVVVWYFEMIYAEWTQRSTTHSLIETLSSKLDATSLTFLKTDPATPATTETRKPLLPSHDISTGTAMEVRTFSAHLTFSSKWIRWERRHRWGSIRQKFKLWRSKLNNWLFNWKKRFWLFFREFSISCTSIPLIPQHL